MRKRDELTNPNGCMGVEQLVRARARRTLEAKP